MLSRMFRKMFSVSPTPLEVMTSVQSILWGMWLILPFDTFDASPVYHVMKIIAREEVWGVYFVVIGVIQIIAIHPIGKKIRGPMSILVLASWVFLDLGFWLSGSSSAASITYLTFVIASIWSVVVLYGHRTRS